MKRRLKQRLPGRHPRDPAAFLFACLPARYVTAVDRRFVHTARDLGALLADLAELPGDDPPDEAGRAHARPRAGLKG
jgi:hypothetical protein